MARKPKTKAEVKAAADRAEARSKTTKRAETLPKPPAVDATTAAVNKGHKLISQNDLKNLLRSIKSLEGDKDESVGMIREKIGYAVEKKNLHKKAFATCRQLDKMEPEKLADYFDNLLAYMDLLGLDERIKSVQRLPLPEGREPAETETPAAEPAPPEGSVSRPRLSVVPDEAENKIPA